MIDLDNKYSNILMNRQQIKCYLIAEILILCRRPHMSSRDNIYQNYKLEISIPLVTKTAIMPPQNPPLRHIIEHNYSN